jgi:hypothetical protein
MNYKIIMQRIPALTEFIYQIEIASSITIPCVGDEFLPRNIIFPNATHLTIVGWDKNGVFYNLNKTRFPNVKRINYLCGSPASPKILHQFTNDPQFIWGLRRTHHRFFDDIKSCQKIIMEPKEYEEQEQLANNELYIKMWNQYINLKIRELE